MQGFQAGFVPRELIASYGIVAKSKSASSCSQTRKRKPVSAQRACAGGASSLPELVAQEVCEAVPNLRGLDEWPVAGALYWLGGAVTQPARGPSTVAGRGVALPCA